jgi:hypothetical protein
VPYFLAPELSANTPAELASLLDKSWDLGKEHFKSGRINVWLKYTPGGKKILNDWESCEVFKEVKSSVKLSEATVHSIREKVFERHDECTPDIKRELKETAIQQAVTEASKISNIGNIINGFLNGIGRIGTIIGIIVGLFLWGSIYIKIIEKYVNPNLLHNRLLYGGFGFIVSVGLIIAIILTARFPRVLIEAIRKSFRKSRENLKQ